MKGVKGRRNWNHIAAAKRLYENTRNTTTEISALVGCTSGSVSTWAGKFEWKRPDGYNPHDKKCLNSLSKAQELFENTTMKAVDIGARVGRAGNTISCWSRQYGWKNENRRARGPGIKSTTNIIPLPAKPKTKEKYPYPNCFADNIDNRSLQIEDNEAHIAFAKFQRSVGVGI